MLLPGMGMWFDVMRDMEHLMNDYTTIFDGWCALFAFTFRF